MTLQIFLQIFSSQVCNIPPIHVAAPSPQRIADALFFRNPIRTERSGGRMGSQPTHTLSASEMRYSPTSPTALC